MGSPYKMPTMEQCQELINEAVSGWTTVNGVNGRKFFNNIDSANYIFIPANGMWSDNRLSNLDMCCSWCTTWADDSSAYAMHSSQSGAGSPYSRFGYYGLSVRAIQLKTKRTLYHRESSPKHLKPYFYVKHTMQNLKSNCLQFSIARSAVFDSTLIIDQNLRAFLVVPFHSIKLSDVND